MTDIIGHKIHLASLLVGSHHFAESTDFSSVSSSLYEPTIPVVQSVGREGLQPNCRCKSSLSPQLAEPKFD